MCCLCTICNQTIAQPNSIWYAAAKLKPLCCFLCGDCLSTIPNRSRIPTDDQRDFDVTFGPLRADVNGSGIYQTYGSRQMAPRFWVPADALEGVFSPDCELMADFYPYMRMDRCLREMVRAEKDGTWPPWPWEERSRVQILMELGTAIRKYLALPPARKVEDGPIISTMREPLEVPPGQARLASELWAEVVMWCDPAGER